jgi:hypothetical protein
MSGGISAGTAVALAGAAGSLASSLSNKSAAGSAGKISKAAYDEQMKQLTRARLDVQGEEASALEKLNPYAGSGIQANDKLMSLMPMLTAKYSVENYKSDPGYTPMVTSLKELQATPGYKFQLEQGLQGVDRSAAARGGLLSGATLKEANNYAQGVAAQGFQAAWERAQNAYQNAFTRDLQTKNSIYDKYSGIVERGLNAAGAQANINMDAGRTLANIGAQMAGTAKDNGDTQAGLKVYQGQQQGNMYTGLANALSSGLGMMAGGGGVTPSTTNMGAGGFYQGFTPQNTSQFASGLFGGQ